VKLHAMHVLYHWSNGLEQSSTEGGSLQMLRCISISCGFIVSGRCQDQPAFLYVCMKKYQKKTARTSLPEDEHLVEDDIIELIH